MSVGLAEIEAARQRIAAHAQRTPVLRSEFVDQRLGARVFFKAEMLQRAGAFKFRGACNAVFALSDSDAARGVVTHSSGNHGAALALAAQLRSIPAFIVMPHNAPRPKRALVERARGVVEECEPTLLAREQAVERVMARTGARLVHPYDDPLVIAGQGTATLELLEDVPELDTLVVPVGGGGLAGGTALAAHGMKPSVKVYGSEPKLADDAARSLQTGIRQPTTGALTVADGLRTALSERTFAILKAHLFDIITVSEQEILDAMQWLWTELKVTVEPSSAVPVAALLRGKIPGQCIGVILSGGNLDFETFGMFSRTPQPDR